MTEIELRKVLDENFKGKAVDLAQDCCMYLTHDGKKCVIGCFIPDGHQAQNCEGSLDQLIVKYPDILNLLPTKSLVKLTTWQSIHDYTLDPDSSIEDQREQLIQSAIKLGIATQ